MTTVFSHGLKLEKDLKTREKVAPRDCLKERNNEAKERQKVLSRLESGTHDNDAIKLTFMLPAEEKKEMTEQLQKANEEGFKEVVDLLFQIDVKEAKCGWEEDETMIDKLVEEVDGGYEEVNRVVRQRLLEWVAKAATVDTEKEIQDLIRRHTMNWYLERAKCICNAKDPKDCRCKLTQYWEEEKINPAARFNPAICKIAVLAAKRISSEREVAWRVTDEQNEEQRATAAGRTEQKLNTRQSDSGNQAGAESEADVKLLRMGTENDLLADQLAIDVDDPDDTTTSNHSLATIVPMNTS